MQEHYPEPTHHAGLGRIRRPPNGLAARLLVGRLPGPLYALESAATVRMREAGHVCERGGRVPAAGAAPFGRGLYTKLTSTLSVAPYVWIFPSILGGRGGGVVSFVDRVTSHNGRNHRTGWA